MICPYRKMTEIVGGKQKSIICYGTECPYYRVEEQYYSSGLETQPPCNRADTGMFLAIHPNYMRGKEE